MKPIVYFSKTITSEKIVELYKKLGQELPGKVAVKVHSGESGTKISCARNFGNPLLIV